MAYSSEQLNNLGGYQTGETYAVPIPTLVPEEIQPEQAVTKRTLFDKGLPRIVMICGGIFLTLATLAVVVGGATAKLNSYGQPAARTPIEPDTDDVSAIATAPEQPHDVGAMQTKLALGTQEHVLATLNQPPPSIPVESSPTPNHVEVIPLEAELPPVPTSVPQAIQTQPLQSVADPLERWQQLAGLGSWGVVQPQTQLTASVAQTANYNQTEVGGRPLEAIQSDPNASTLAQARDLEAENLLLRGQIQRTVPVGARAQGELSAPLYWSGASDISSLRASLRLTEPLVDRRGAIALPSGTEILARITQIDAGTGFLQLEGVLALIPAESGVSELPLPAGALTIQGGEGPLLATRANDPSGRIARRGAGSAILSGLSRGAATAALGNTSSSFSSGFGGSSSSFSQERDPNFALGFLEGSAGSLSTQAQQRNQRTIQQLEQQAPIWQIEAGQPVSLFVRQSLSL